MEYIVHFLEEEAPSNCISLNSKSEIKEVVNGEFLHKLIFLKKNTQITNLIKFCL